MEQTNHVTEEIVTPDTTYMCGACYEWFPTIEGFNAHDCPAGNVVEDNGVEGAATFGETCTVVQTEGDLEKDVANILGEMKYSIPSRASSMPTVVGTDDQGVPIIYEQNYIKEEGMSVIYDQNVIGQDGVVYTQNYVNQDGVIYDQNFIQQDGVIYDPSFIKQGGVIQDQTFIINYEVQPDQGGVSDLVEQKVEVDVPLEVPADSVVGNVEIPTSYILPKESQAYPSRPVKDNSVGKRFGHDIPYGRQGPWNDASTKALIQHVKEVPEAFFIASDNVKRTEAWELIRNRLSRAGFHFTVLQIRMKLRELCKIYRNIVDYNEMHGEIKACEHFDELNDLFGIWDEDSTRILIRELAGKDLKQGGGLRMKFNTWDKISKVLLDHGYNFTAHQVHGRWNALVTLYQRMIDHNANPENERMSMAYQLLIEPMYSYVSNKKFKTPPLQLKESKDKWPVRIERCLLQAYTDNIENFRKCLSKNSKEVWAIIVEKLRREQSYITTIERARSRFYELAKHYSTMVRYNSQPGALYREARHHEILGKIYSFYNMWPHDGSVIKLDNSNARRIRQLNAQLRWTEDDSRAVLQIYPQVLTEHLQSADQQPLEELWVQMAKTLMSIKNISKLPYEIEEHIVLLRRGFKSDNPFPFQAEMEELEDTEHSLCFSPEESPSTDMVQMIPYWSHMAACTLLDCVIHYRQEGVKSLNEIMYEIISMGLEAHGYKYSGKECRQYYQLLRKMLKNKTQPGGEYKEKETNKSPYIDRMRDLKTVAQFQIEDSNEVRMKILEAASSKLEMVMGEDVLSRQQDMEMSLSQLKIHLMNNNLIRPPPPVKYIAQTLLRFMKREVMITSVDLNAYFARLRMILNSNLDVLALIAEGGPLLCLEKLLLEGRKRLHNKGYKPDIPVEKWKDENIQILLTTVKEWRRMCHNEGELDSILRKSQSLWEEVSYNLNHQLKKSPEQCKEYFDALCYQYMKEQVQIYQSGSSDVSCESLPPVCQNLLKIILSPIVSHNADMDPRDIPVTTSIGTWTQKEILELLFTVRELLTDNDEVDWEQVRLLMSAGGFERAATIYQTKFIDLYNGYKRAHFYNKDCLIRARRRPPYYFKIHSLFGYKDSIRKASLGSWRSHFSDVGVNDVTLRRLIVGLKEKKNLSCHMVPRVPLLKSLCTYLDEHHKVHYGRYSPNVVWYMLVKLHKIQLNSISTTGEGPYGEAFDALWLDQPNPLFAYGVKAIPSAGWQWVKNWSAEEIGKMLDNVIKQCLPHSTGITDQPKIPNTFFYQLGYMLSTFKHGGYKQFEKQLNLVYMLQKWCHLILKEGNNVLKKVKENYRKIEQSNMAKVTFNGLKISQFKEDEEDALSNTSIDSDDLDIFSSDSEVDRDLEETDTDEEGLQAMSMDKFKGDGIGTKPKYAYRLKPSNKNNRNKTIMNNNSFDLDSAITKNITVGKSSPIIKSSPSFKSSPFSKNCPIVKSSPFNKNSPIIRSSSTLRSSPIKDSPTTKNNPVKSNSDFKYVFRVTTTPQVKIGVRTMKHTTEYKTHEFPGNAQMSSDSSLLPDSNQQKQRSIQVSVMKHMSDDGKMTFHMNDSSNKSKIGSKSPNSDSPNNSKVDSTSPITKFIKKKKEETPVRGQKRKHFEISTIGNNNTVEECDVVSKKLMKEQDLLRNVDLSLFSDPPPPRSSTSADRTVQSEEKSQPLDVSSLKDMSPNEAVSRLKAESGDIASRLEDEDASEMNDKLADDVASEMKDKPVDDAASRLEDKSADDAASRLKDKSANETTSRHKEKSPDKAILRLKGKSTVVPISRLKDDSRLSKADNTPKKSENKIGLDKPKSTKTSPIDTKNIQKMIFVKKKSGIIEKQIQKQSEEKPIASTKEKGKKEENVDTPNPVKESDTEEDDGERVLRGKGKKDPKESMMNKSKGKESIGEKNKKDSKESMVGKNKEMESIEESNENEEDIEMEENKQGKKRTRAEARREEKESLIEKTRGKAKKGKNKNSKENENSINEKTNRKGKKRITKNSEEEKESIKETNKEEEKYSLRGRGKEEKEKSLEKESIEEKSIERGKYGHRGRSKKGKVSMCEKKESEKESLSEKNEDKDKENPTEKREEESEETFIELTNKYYKRREQDKERLMTTLNSVQESHQKQASSLLQMFDNLRELL